MSGKFNDWIQSRRLKDVIHQWDVSYPECPKQREREREREKRQTDRDTMVYFIVKLITSEPFCRTGCETSNTPI